MQSPPSHSVHLLNLHYALHVFSEAVSNFFGPIYLYSLGLPIWFICLVWIAVFLMRILVRPLGRRAALRLGLRRTIIVGSVFFALLMLILGQTTGIDIWLFAYIVWAGFCDVFYWLPYHTYLSLIGDELKRGKQLGLREIYATIANILAPLLAGLLVYQFGFGITFLAAAIGMGLSVLPLFFLPDVLLAPQMSLRQAVRKVSWRGFFLFACESIPFVCYGFLWIFVLFILLENAVSYGGLLSIASLMQAIIFYVVGHMADRKKMPHLYMWGAGLIILDLLLRAWLPLNVPLVLALDLLRMLAFSLFYPLFQITLYNSGKSSPQPLWFTFFAETGCDIGSIFTLLIVMILLYFHIDLQATLLVGILGVLFTTFIVSPQYRRLQTIKAKLLG